MKVATVYKTLKNEFKIVTQSKTTAGYLIYVLPVYVIPAISSDEILLSTVIKALDNSTDGMKAPERSDFPKIQRDILSQLKEKSFNKLYSNSTSCNLRVENGAMKIYPNKLVTDGPSKGGLVWVEEDKVTIEDSEKNHDLVIFTIRKILDHKY
jgi:hypothetical protein